MTGRTDTGSRLIAATPAAIFHALTDAAAVATWRAPQGMQGEVEAFDPRPGGRYRMVLRYLNPGSGPGGKASEDTDVVEGRFVELVPDVRVVEEVQFESDDPSFAGTMRITTSLSLVAGGTTVEVACADVPAGIREEDHLAGIASSLENLARFVQ